MASKPKTSPSKKRKVTASKRKDSLFSRRKKLFISIGAGLVVFLVGAFLLVSWAAASHVSFIGIGGKCLDNNAQKAVNGNKIQLYTCNNSKAQQWKVNSNSSITNANGYCLDVKSASKVKGTIVQLYKCNGTVAQRWKVNSNKTITNPNSGLCLDAKGSSTANGTQIIVWTCKKTNNANQIWTAKSASPLPPPVVPPANPPTTPLQTPPTGGERKHFIMNAGTSDLSKVRALGYNVIDLNPDTSAINSLPAGVQAMVWVGGAQCESFSYPFSSFKTFVNNNRNNSKIYGYFLYDEPNSHQCSQFVDKAGSDDDIKGRADFIHCLSNETSKVNAAGQCLEGGRVVSNRTDKKAFIIDEYQFDYARVSHAKTHVDLFGIDPYPCRPSGCVYSGGSDRFRERIALAKQHYSQSSVAPVYQAFGGDGWKLPTASELNTMLSTYDSNLSGTAFDATYTWRQNTAGQNASLSESTSLQQVLKAHNNKY